MDPKACQRWEMEMNQVSYAWEYESMPKVEVIGEASLFECDVFVFCASKNVPADLKPGEDVRMMQYEGNRSIIEIYARKAREAKYKGLFAVVSDPVEPLCKRAFLASNCSVLGDDNSFDGEGLKPEQVQGYGLGVMNARAAYYASKEPRFHSFLKEGRAYGPHGEHLVIANSVTDYDRELSIELTKMAVEANLRVRDIGYKPFVAPALSSAAISILQTLKGEWHYSSIFMGGVYFGCKNRFSKFGLEAEARDLPEPLFHRITEAYQCLQRIE